MNIFELRDKIIEEYSSFVNGFINIKDSKASNYVLDKINKGLLWPDPLVQINPFFTLGESVKELVSQGFLHPDCEKIFCLRNEKEIGSKPLQLYKHQSDAIKKAVANESYILTTGTGSGKSMAYIIPIVNHILQTGSGKGIKAIIIYPMNALANSQKQELEKFINPHHKSSANNISFRCYTGQENDAERQEILANPPDIILTNYVMLELILTRPDETPLVSASKNLKFLVLDELHTYRGRQGADVAMLIRRVKEATGTKDVIFVGTSATLSSGDIETQKQEIAKVSSLLFGIDFNQGNVIGESLERITAEYDFTNRDELELLKKEISEVINVPKLEFEQIKHSHLASWIESNFGIRTDPKTGILVRSEPISITGPKGGARLLHNLTDKENELCVRAIQKMLMLGFQTLNPINSFPVFAFRLHQFISRGQTVYASLEDNDSRYFTMQKQLYVPDTNKLKVLLPLTFCRFCGQDFYTVHRTLNKDNETLYTPRELYDIYLYEEDAGFLYLPDNPDCDLTAMIPPEWKDINGNIIAARKYDMPEKVSVRPDGIENPAGRIMYFFKTPFRFCPSCGVSFDATQRSDFPKLTALGTEGRASATTILSLSVIRNIKQMDMEDKAKKLLSFTDNRQDASLQAGHFNDFIQIGLLRGALYQALVNAGSDGIRHSELAQKVFDCLNLNYEEYASNPLADRDSARIYTERALCDVLGYRLYYDLRRGWRITAPNLEQTGLLKIDYLALEELAYSEEEWQNCHPALSSCDHQARYNILKTLLELMRRSLTIKVNYLDPRFQDIMLQNSHQRLIPPWGFDESTQSRNLTYASILYLDPNSNARNRGSNLYVTPRSSYGQYLRRATTFKDYKTTIDLQQTKTIIENLIDRLTRYGIIEKVDDKNNGYQLVADSIIWKQGDGKTGYYDPLHQPTESLEGQPVNEFFKEYYSTIALTTHKIYAREHTAQVSYEERKKRETAFREGTLPILYCSPTMELGIDISWLNVVNMRNIPPTPANYAQRSGRAGRSGQPALILSYCSTGSPHDQYFYKHPEKMVSGVVSTPQIDIANENLLHSHINAIWLSEAKLSLGRALNNIIDISTEKLELLPSVKSTLNNSELQNRAFERAESVIATVQNYLQSTIWFNNDWLTDVIKQIPNEFEQACERWRDLYRAALNQQQLQNSIILDVSRSAADRKQAKQLRKEAETQLNLLTSIEGAFQSDFYSYRYFASEGFLPGYNFPRLPLSAYIPARGTVKGEDEYLNRPRFLAITEFGPRSLIYHEGSKYIISQVIMPPTRDNNNLPSLASMKLCAECGYLNGYENDICENCKAQLDSPLTNLFRMQNVVAKRREQISCDEEERLRMGYEMRTTIRFAKKGGKLSCFQTELYSENELLAKLTYGDSADIWRINMGFKKNHRGRQLGFWLDSERGFWERNPDTDNEDDSPLGNRRILVCPYVSDTKNCLLFEPQFNAEPAVMASLQSALKNAIQQVFDIEDNELAAEPLPNRNVRHSILFYESAEGGAGVLKRLMDEQNFRKTIRKALEICHYDPDSFTDLEMLKNASERCEAACYDCLLSYKNQLDHLLLDRKSIIIHLKEMLNADFKRSSSEVTRLELYHQLRNLCGSELESKWLDFIYNNNYILPLHAQQLIEKAQTRPDFTYPDIYVAIYIDGQVHDFSNNIEKDREVDARLDDLGWKVIRFLYNQDWQTIIDQHPEIFGTRK
ncbi:MAG TPA: DEAD/DEAH box helicase [Candidatus Cloacimonas sp.]|nr:DEAD/DEAH box helicase [Candidatus Cloacimonas sp.]HOQ77718.1 DEAD/DEAH box helicase [Candidatus Cloacimonas sp.]HPK60114.1 DEAD/DEAH box helicase [Candidatus Cloacimonas sp.]HPV63871.1 DEAD/DEAH box helicase [Candidatus Cloacimonas sp.]